MSLSKRQQKFTVAIAELILYADSLGYKLTFGDAYRDHRLHGAPNVKKGYGHPKSKHKYRLAVDFNLFVDGVYIQDSTHAAWGVLHQYWETHCGGASAFLSDMNHFEYDF